MTLETHSIGQSRPRLRCRPSPRCRCPRTVSAAGRGRASATPRGSGARSATGRWRSCSGCSSSSCSSSSASSPTAICSCSLRSMRKVGDLTFKTAIEVENCHHQRIHFHRAGLCSCPVPASLRPQSRRVSRASQQQPRRDYQGCEIIYKLSNQYLSMG